MNTTFLWYACSRSRENGKGDVGMTLGNVIRKYRKMRDMTQEEMAKRLGVTGAAVNKCDEETYDFLRDDQRWKKLVGK